MVILPSIHSLFAGRLRIQRLCDFITFPPFVPSVALYRSKFNSRTIHNILFLLARIYGCIHMHTPLMRVNVRVLCIYIWNYQCIKMNFITSLSRLRC